MAEVAAADERRKQREQERIAKATADADAADALAASQVAGPEATTSDDASAGES
jgi:hypothetical protein